MLVCLDPKSGETVYVKSDEVKLAGTQSADDFANGYRQKLQMKNSEPYNQAAQEQAMQDAAKLSRKFNQKKIKMEKKQNVTLMQVLMNLNKAQKKLLEVMQRQQKIIILKRCRPSK